MRGRNIFGRLPTQSYHILLLYTSVISKFKNFFIVCFTPETTDTKSDNLVKAFDVLTQRAEDDESNVLFTVANDLAKVCMFLSI